MADRTSNGRPIRMLTIVDEFTRECLAIDVAKKLTSEDVLERLSDLFVCKGVPSLGSQARLGQAHTRDLQKVCCTS